MPYLQHVPQVKRDSLQNYCSSIFVHVRLDAQTLHLLWRLQVLDKQPRRFLQACCQNPSWQLAVAAAVPISPCLARCGHTASKLLPLMVDGLRQGSSPLTIIRFSAAAKHGLPRIP
jgi:hypothetical protein